MRSSVAAVLFSVAITGTPAEAGVYFTDQPEGADLLVYIITDPDDMSEVACWINEADVDPTVKPGDLKLYVTKDRSAAATWVSITDDAQLADPLACLTSE